MLPWPCVGRHPNKTSRHPSSTATSCARPWDGRRRHTVWRAGRTCSHENSFLDFLVTDTMRADVSPEDKATNASSASENTGFGESSSSKHWEIAAHEEMFDGKRLITTNQAASRKGVGNIYLLNTAASARSRQPFRSIHPTQSTNRNPVTRSNSRVLWVTSVASSANAWQAIQRSLAPIGVPASLRRVNCSA